MRIAALLLVAGCARWSPDPPEPAWSLAFEVTAPVLIAEDGTLRTLVPPGTVILISPDGDEREQTVGPIDASARLVGDRAGDTVAWVPGLHELVALDPDLATRWTYPVDAAQRFVALAANTAGGVALLIQMTSAQQTVVVLALDGTVTASRAVPGGGMSDVRLGDDGGLWLFSRGWFELLPSGQYAEGDPPDPGGCPAPAFVPGEHVGASVRAASCDTLSLFEIPDQLDARRRFLMRFAPGTNRELSRVETGDAATSVLGGDARGAYVVAGGELWRFSDP